LLFFFVEIPKTLQAVYQQLQQVILIKEKHVYKVTQHNIVIVNTRYTVVNRCEHHDSSYWVSTCVLHACVHMSAALACHLSEDGKHEMWKQDVKKTTTTKKNQQDGSVSVSLPFFPLSLSLSLSLFPPAWGDADRPQQQARSERRSKGPGSAKSSLVEPQNNTDPARTEYDPHGSHGYGAAVQVTRQQAEAEAGAQVVAGGGGGSGGG